MQLLRKIQRHLERTGTAESRFGRDAANDPRLVADLRGGRSPGPALVARVEAWIAEAEAAR